MFTNLTYLIFYKFSIFTSILLDIDSLKESKALKYIAIQKMIFIIFC